jgi:hypothetical protein
MFAYGRNTRTNTPLHKAGSSHHHRRSLRQVHKLSATTRICI